MGWQQNTETWIWLIWVNSHKWNVTSVTLVWKYFHKIIGFNSLKWGGDQPYIIQQNINIAGDKQREIVESHAQ